MHKEFSPCTLHCPQVRQLHDVDLSKLQFVGDALSSLRQEVHGQVSSGLACMETMSDII